MNVFFYPVPYVSDTVSIYNVHTVYITQYDIELIILISPSTISRGNKDILDPKNSPIVTCNRISDYDKCGYKMSDDDPCLTDIILRRFPHIDGYIGLAEQDVALFNKKYKDLVNKYNRHDMIKQIIPSIITNIRELSGIPEIVIHPLRFRHQDCFRIPGRFYNSEQIVKYCIKNRAQYNYFPLLYFTNNGTFTFNDLKDMKNIELISKSVRLLNNSPIPQIYEDINNIFSKMLEEGYKVNNILYKVYIDVRTGFYRVFIDKKTNNNRYTRKKVLRKYKDNDFEGYLDTYIVKPNNDPRINTIIESHKNYMEYLPADLNANGFSIKKKLVFDRKNKNNFILNYHIDKVLDRPDLEKYRNMHKRIKNITQKNTKNSSIYSSLILNGFSPNNFNDISSINSNDIM